MAVEIERKFLLKNLDFIPLSTSKKTIKQGFLNSHKERVVRIRIAENLGYITVKGISSTDGTSRFEWEKEISLEEAESLLLLCEKGIIEKTRYLHQYKNHWFEIDIFHGENEGLILAEVELSDTDEFFEKPAYLGEEVTGNKKYYNSYLSKDPFQFWT